MSNEGISDGQIGEALLIRVVQDQMNTIEIAKFSLPCLPEVQPLSSVQDQKLSDQLFQTVKMITVQLFHNQIMNRGKSSEQRTFLVNKLPSCLINFKRKQIDDLARLCDRKIFSKLVEGVFSDGLITWGRIIVLYYAIGRLAVKMVLANMSRVFSEILDSCLDFFRTKLLVWIHNIGGWISSISALTQFSSDHISASSACTIPLPGVLIKAFVCGILLGGAIVWKLNRSS